MSDNRFKPGQRVSFYVWGVRHEGTIIRHMMSGVVYVLDSASLRATWKHAESLSLVE